MRKRLDYTATTAAPISQGFDPDRPVAGLYRMRLRSGAVPVAVRIWFGTPIEPWTGEPMDRASRWNATVNGQWIELDRVWPQCAGDPIDAAEAAHLARLQAWGRECGFNAIADPTRRLDPLSAPLPF